MGDQYKNVMIAFFVLAALSIVVFVLMFIHPSIGDEKKVIRARFTDIDKINVGTRVTYGGKPVGEVTEIREILGEKDHRMSRDGKIYLYELELKVDSGVNVFNSDEISSRTSGLLGEKSVAIVPYPTKPGEKLRRVDSETLYASESGTVEQTFKEFKEVADKFDLALDNVNRILDELQHEHTFRSIARAASNVADITEALNKPKEISDIIANVQHFTSNVSSKWNTIDSVINNIETASDNFKDITTAINQPDNLSDTVGNVHKLTERAVDTWDSVDVAVNDIAATASNTRNISGALNEPQKIRNIVANVDSASGNLAVTMPQVNVAALEIAATARNTHYITDRISCGDSTLGKLLVEDDLYLRLIAILNKGEVIFNDINHYGLLFHLDKGWQRLRARRLNLLGKLCSPQEFRNYFNDEIDNITTSLARVSMVLDENACLYPCGLLLDDNEFAKVYAELLRRVSTMEEELKLYNQQVVDSQLPRTELVAPRCQY